MTVNNDACFLEQQMDRTRQDVAIVPPVEMTSQPLRFVAAASTAKIPKITLTLVATVSPPVVGGATLQASGVTLKSDYAIVSYMIKGDPRGGALDVIDIRDESHPTLVSRATFSDADVIASDWDDSRVYYVGATSDPSFAAPAFLGTIKLTSHQLDLTDVTTTGLLSYAGTSITLSNKKNIYTASGSSGALSSFSYSNGDSTLSKAFDYKMHDARAVYADGDQIGVVGGTPGTLAVFTEGASTPLGTYGFTGADVPEAKSGLEISGKKAFIAAGTGGVQVLSTVTGKLVGQLARPDARALGLDPSVVTTNGVSADGDLLFICNGEAGIYVAAGGDSFASTDSEATQTLTLAGQLKLGTSLSANHVAYRGDSLMIATGLGGLKIVEVVEE